MGNEKCLCTSGEEIISDLCAGECCSAGCGWNHWLLMVWVFMVWACCSYLGKERANSMLMALCRHSWSDDAISSHTRLPGSGCGPPAVEGTPKTLRRCSSGSSSSYISSFSTISRVIRSAFPVRFLCISLASKADLSRASRSRSLRREAAMNARSLFSSCDRPDFDWLARHLWH